MGPFRNTLGILQLKHSISRKKTEYCKLQKRTDKSERQTCQNKSQFFNINSKTKGGMEYISSPERKSPSSLITESIKIYPHD
jgi:hypothetical protein